MGRELRLAVRMVLKYPGFTLAAVLTLGLGIGANTALFSVANTLFLRPPAWVTAPDRLVVLGRVSSDAAWQGFGHESYQRYRDAARSFSGLTAFRGARVLWQAEDQTIPLDAMLVTGDYFVVLGVRMAQGRGFVPDEDRTPGVAPVVVVSAEAWRGRFGADRALVGRTIRLNDTQFTVVGIAPPGFRGLDPGSRIDLWIPLMMEQAVRPRFPVLNSDFFSVLTPVARLAPGVDLAQAQAELTVLADRLERPQGPEHEATRVVATPHLSLPDPGWRAYVTSFLAPLHGAAGMVLLVVCANLAGLLAARSTARRREMAVRVALGATRGRLIGQVIGEGLVLVVPGALAGLMVSRVVLGLIRTEVADDIIFTLDGRVLAFAAGLSVLSVLLFSLVPAVRAAPRDPVRDLKDDRGAGPRRSLLRSGLVTAQVAVSLVLVTGTLLLVRTLQKAMAVDVGFETRHLLAFRPELALAGYSGSRALEFNERTANALRALPGVQSVSWATTEPVVGPWQGTRQVIADGETPPGERPRIEVAYNEVGPRYFETLGLPVARGRGIVTADGSTAPLVAVINQAMARRTWHGEDPLGRRLRLVLFMDYSPPIEVVGVVPDVRTASLSSEVQPQVFVPYAQYAKPEQNLDRGALVLLRVAPGFSDTRAIRDAVHRLDPGLPAVGIESMADRMRGGLADQRLYAKLVGLFGALALLLAAIGLYGLLAFDVTRRTREIGVRMALGAMRGDILSTVMRQGLVFVGVGIALGLSGSMLLTKVLSSMLYGVTPRDPLAFVVATVLILSVAALAMWLPARRATTMDPVTALRTE